MPSYCSAVNCKNNGFTNADLSFFKFPDHRKSIADKWIEAIGRKNWKPTKYSRLCSIHFEENCFFLKKGTRLRLLPDALPTIFDFRKIKSNRKQAEQYLNMNENDCPDPELYELQMEPVIVKSAKSGQKCIICSAPADCDMKTDSIVKTEKGTYSLSAIIESIANISSEKSVGFICLACSRRLINAHMLKFEIEQNVNFTVKESTTSSDKDTSEDISIEQEQDLIPCTSNEKPLHSQESDDVFDIIYCAYCDINFKREQIGNHLLNCKMKEEADEQNIPTDNRRLFVCALCQFLMYKHNANDHLEVCYGKSLKFHGDKTK